MEPTSDILARGWSALQAGDLPGAEQAYRRAVAVDAANSRAWYLLGVAAQLQGKRAEAIASYRRALELESGLAEAHNNLGLALHDQGETAEAEACYHRALEQKPDYADAHNNLGNALQAQGRLAEAVASYQRALQLRPEYVEALHNLGNVLRVEGKLSEAAACYDRALALRPDHAQAHLSRALLWIQQGDVPRGWDEFEWRWRCPEFPPPPFRQPLWDGRPLEGRTILLYADHGLGDTIQFIRYAPLVAQRGGCVLVACQQSLVRVLATCPGIDRLIGEGERLPDFDVYAPLMSLPRLFRTTLATVPAAIPYLHVEPAVEERWAHALEPLRASFKVGVAWQGSRGYRKDRERSFRLAQLEPLAHVDGVRLASLQIGYGTEQLAETAGRFAVTDLSAGQSDLMDAAAIMRNLDLVVTPDTALAHLAGALGVPVWLALALEPEARWMLGRDDSPWYPSMRLFRQTAWGDWEGVFTRMAVALAVKDRRMDA